MRTWFCGVSYICRKLQDKNLFTTDTPKSFIGLKITGHFAEQRLQLCTIKCHPKPAVYIKSALHIHEPNSSKSLCFTAAGRFQRESCTAEGKEKFHPQQACHVGNGDAGWGSVKGLARGKPVRLERRQGCGKCHLWNF